MKETTVFDCSLVHFRKNHTERGSISSVNNNTEIPFSVKRIYYLYDVPGGEERGAHAHINLKQLIIAASGSFDLTVDDGSTRRTFQLNRPDMGVLMPAGLWRGLNNFSSGSICLVLASEEYYEEDYVRDYSEFLNLKK